MSDKEMIGMFTGMAAKAFAVKSGAPPAGPMQPTPPNAKPAPGAEAGNAGDAKQLDWIMPLRDVGSFRAAWLRGPQTTTVDFDPQTRIVTLEGEEQLGGFQFKQPWREIHLSLHAETITGQFEIQVNDTTLKFGTATALIRRPATVILTFDEANSHLIATIGTRQVARATVLSDKFLSSFTCQLRCDGGKTRLKVNELKVKLHD
jgi:hypothetical protein